MLVLGLFIMAVISTGHFQLDGLCPSSRDYVRMCAAQFIDSVSELSGRFTEGASVLNFNMIEANTVHVVCTNMKPMENFFKCFYTKFEACISKEWRKALPSIEQTLNSISHFCNNADDINITCVSVHTLSVPVCLSQAVSQRPTVNLTGADEYVRYMCSSYPLMESCYKNALVPCPAKSGEIMARYIEYQTPAACGATMVSISWTLLVTSLCYTWIQQLI